MKEKSMRETFHLSFGEEVGNAVSHGVMGLACLFSLPAVAVYSYIEGGALRSTGVSIFVICLFLMFIVSTIYHSMEYGSNHKYVFRKLDHICIYFAIAGSYTPIALCMVQGTTAFWILVLEWGAVIFGIFLKSIAKKSYPKLSMCIYMAMGWAAVLFIPDLISKATPMFWALILGGGLMYSIGAYFYSKRVPYCHFIWHIMINLASILHFIAIVFVM